MRVGAVLVVLAVVGFIAAGIFGAAGHPGGMPADVTERVLSGDPLSPPQRAEPTERTTNRSAGRRTAPEQVEAMLPVVLHATINRIRMAHELDLLAYDTKLEDVATYHANGMATGGYVAHDSPRGDSMADRYDRFGYDCQIRTGQRSYLTGGENVAKSYLYERIRTDNGTTFVASTDELARTIVDQWMVSPSHRRNILTSEWEAEAFGVAVVEEDDALAVYVAQNFC